jgi:replicative DNA helicase
MNIQQNSLENRIDNILNEKIQTTFLNSGFPKLDELIGEFSSSDFIVFGGRPMMGKTAFMISLALNFSLKNRVLFLNLDTPEENISNRFLASITGIPYSNLKTKKLNKGQLFTLEKTKNELLKYNLQVESQSIENAEFLEKIIKNHIEKYETKVIFIDTLPTIVDSVFYAEYNSYSAKLNHELKKIAKELDVCIICSCELSRDVELRGGDRRPMIADLLSCQNLEEVADKIIFIYRPEHYGLTEDMEGESTIDHVELIVAKSDIGCDETLILKQCKNFTKFY